MAGTSPRVPMPSGGPEFREYHKNGKPQTNFVSLLCDALHKRNRFFSMFELLKINPKFHSLNLKHSKMIWESEKVMLK